MSRILVYLIIRYTHAFIGTSQIDHLNLQYTVVGVPNHLN